MEFPNPPIPGPASPEHSGYLGLSLPSLQRKILLPLPGSWSLWPSPDHHHTSALNTSLAHRSVSGVGDLEDITQSLGPPGFSALATLGWGHE